MKSAEELRELFLLEAGEVYLNHGSFGATPRPVFDAYQHWQLELERQPVRFMVERLMPELDRARAPLGEVLNVAPQHLLYVTNTTHAINTVARSLNLQPGDEVLATDHEYGALDTMWQLVCEAAGARYVRQAIPLPYSGEEKFMTALWAGVTPRTKVIFASHVTSVTALVFPAEAICRRARAEGIVSIIDGAHAPGQIPLDLIAIDPDFYAGNCHKWLCAPKGSAFLFIRPELQDNLKPLVASWGQVYGGNLGERFHWRGTEDFAAYLSVPAALDFQREYEWDAVRERCYAQVADLRDQLEDVTGFPRMVAPDSGTPSAQMVSTRLPACNPEAFRDDLYKRYRIEVLVNEWASEPYMRVSVQGYVTRADTDALVAALHEMLAR